MNPTTVAPWSNTVLFFGILIMIAVVAGTVWYMVKVVNSSSDTQKGLTLLMTFGFAAMVGVFVLSKIAALRIKILTDAESLGIFELVKYVVVLLFGYFFGSKKDDKDANT